mmetsp:Transcript_22044/g.47942  ORF Transcript_22044/g.47942 Transcript_22044/m.47942 type:complete len:2140 (-) Transcript_22044:37-6456(-)
MESILISLESSDFGERQEVDNENSSSAIIHSEESYIAFSNALRQFFLDDVPSPLAAAAATSTATAAAASSLTSQPSTTATWIYETCSRVPSPLPTLQFSLAVLSAIAAGEHDESKMQSSLFELFGEGEQSIEYLFEVMGKSESIRQVTEEELKSIAESKGDVVASAPSAAAATSSSHAHEHLHKLRAEAYEAADLATALRTDLDSFSNNNYSSRGTHSVTRKSDKDAEKTYKRAIKQALVAVSKAREEGALTESDDMFLKDQLSANGSSGGGGSAMEQMMLRNEEAMLYNAHNTRGLDGMNAQQIQSMKFNLLPEGTKEYNDSGLRGLPRGTEREVFNGYEKVTIPAPILETSMLRARINLDEALGSDADERMAFEGTKSLNPMQSTVFDAAYNTRENLLICAPTGAGKTNVAMLTVVSHLRDVGLIGSAYHDGDHHYDNGPVTTGKKIVYIAPMKALAQEVTEKFSSKLKPLGIIVKELTGDMQLSRAEAEAAHILVTTPEKWDVVTRKGGDGSLGATCGLLIIDEVHLLADERGAVIESVVARLHRWVESSQRQVRLVGLSATLPNHEDVATFLRVDKKNGLFFFGPEHRPVPLQQAFIGVTAHTKNRFQREKKMDEVCYEVAADALRNGHQVMVFVHSRKGTGTTAKALGEHAAMEGELERLFIGEEGENDARTKYIDKAEKSRNKELREHFRNGMGIHHAGMLRPDRRLTEMMFNDGAIKLLCCTATLAWGINLPAHTVIIKGTDVYMAEKGTTVDLSILDVMQIFGRAGRPQFDTSGEATLITSHDAMARYLDKLVRATPIESNFIKQLADHMNAEVVGGTVTNIREAVEWIRYTYLHVRMCKNPLAYGINAIQHESDPTLRKRSNELVIEAAKLLDERKMVRYNPDSGNLAVTNLGRVASHFYIRNQSVHTFNEMLEKKRTSPTDADLLHVMCCADEFENVRVRPEELDEVDRLKKESCPLDTFAPVEEFSGKCNVLLQSYVSKARVTSFTLISDTNYIASNAGRVSRALFEMCLKNGNAPAALKFLRLAKSIDHRFWWFQSPLRAFEHELKKNVYVALEDSKVASGDGYNTFERAISLLDMEPTEVGQLCHCFRDGALIQKFVRMLPRVEVSCNVLPITKSTLRFHIELNPVFNWSARHHGGAEGFWLWIEDNENNRTYHNEYILLSKRTHPETKTLEVIVPVFDPMPQQYFIRIVSDSWVGCEFLIPVSFRHVLIEGLSSPTFFTNLADLTPLPVQALADPRYEQLYSNRFDVFNPIQTQLFHILYHTDTPVLLGAPTGSGKTAVAELALLRMKKQNPKAKCVYIAPLKSLARERLKEWSKKLGAPPLKWKVLELSGDTSHDSRALNNSDVLICTPEKWDLISRGWRGVSGDFSSSSASNGKRFVREIGLLIIDEIHLLGEERGAVLEAIVSRTRFISRHVQAENQRQSSPSGGKAPEVTRIMGLSTALANPYDLADWIGIDTEGYGIDAKKGLYNFRPSVRPVPMLVHIQGYPGRHYCPRMATMNKPCYAAIKDLSPNKPAMIFVASRRQTRLTAFDLISHAAGEENPKSFLHCDEEYVEAIAQTLNDKALQHTITFGIGLHHAGLTSRDRETVERLFLEGHIQVLIATATLAWGVNLPAHLVIVKGTEFFDGKLSRYVDYPVTDILQMMGRAGRPQFDKEGVAVIMCEESKKTFLKKFLYEPFPVESCLGDRMCETINAEVSIGTINSLSDAIGYLEWTFYARRVKLNPSYYGAKSSEDNDIADFFLEVVQSTAEKLQDHGCICIDKTEGSDSLITTTPLGRAASNFYVNHQTPKQMMQGSRGLRKVLAQYAPELKRGSNLRKEEFLVGDAESKKRVENIYKFNPEHAMYTFAIAKVLFELSATHEFNELPVRHSEEELNLELSRSLPWGYDLSKVSWWTDKHHHPGKNILDIMASPHTKCFLLLQAFIFKGTLPISDYINDMRSVVEQIPRLLAAMEFIALDDKASAGNFEMFSCFPLVRRVLSTGVMIGAKSSSASNTPSIKFRNFKVEKELKKASNSHTGFLDFDYNIELNRYRRTNERKANQGKNGGLGVTFVLGTLKGGYLLNKSSLSVPGFQKEKSWKKHIRMDFDWNTADANAGQDQHLIVLRVLHEFASDSDFEILVSLKR